MDRRRQRQGHQTQQSSTAVPPKGQGDEPDQQYHAEIDRNGLVEPRPPQTRYQIPDETPEVLDEPERAGEEEQTDGAPEASDLGRSGGVFGPVTRDSEGVAGKCEEDDERIDGSRDAVPPPHPQQQYLSGGNVSDYTDDENRE